MIKANELRIGNLINYNEQYCKVVSLYDDGIIWFDDKNNDSYSSEVYEPNPIPLTPEILEKAGFEKYEKIKDECWHKGNFEIFKTSSPGYSMDIEKDIYPELIYLHQLQNLYFALTGEELTIENIKPQDVETTGL